MWFPQQIRNLMTEYLLFASGITKVYQPAALVLGDLLKEMPKKQVMDLCAGGGTSLHLKKSVEEFVQEEVNWILTDKFPNQTLTKTLQKVFQVNINVSCVDVFSPPINFKGVFTLFTAFHHFNPQQAQLLLKNLSATHQPIAIFEAGSCTFKDVLKVGILPIVALLFCTPFIKPFRWSRIFFTYLLPVLPFCILWDGTVSMLRQYNTAMLLEMAEKAAPHYHWEAKSVASNVTTLTYLVGRLR